MSMPAGLYRARYVERAREIIATDRRFRQAKRLSLPADCDDFDRFLVVAYQTVSVKQIAAMLEISDKTVQRYLTPLRRRGLIAETMRVHRRPSAPAEYEAVRELLTQGYSRGVVAMLLGVTPVRVHQIAARLGVSSRGRYPKPAPYGVPQVAKMFCVSRLTVIRWVSNGWLPDLRPDAARNKSVAHWWHGDDLVTFVRDRRTWPAWSPATLTDPALRRIAEEARREAGGQWMYRCEIARYLNIPDASLKLWTRRGLFAWREEGYGRALWLTNDDLAAMDLMLIEADRRGLRGRKRMGYLHGALRERFGEERRE